MSLLIHNAAELTLNEIIFAWNYWTHLSKWCEIPEGTCLDKKHSLHPSISTDELLNTPSIMRLCSVAFPTPHMVLLKQYYIKDV